MEELTDSITIIKKFVTKEEEKKLVKYINKQEWNDELSRQVQHYGWKYNYRSKNVREKAEPIPDIIKECFDTYHNFNKKSQVIVNKYEPGQGISSHIDSRIFDDTIMSLSLLSDISMRFTKGTDRVDILLPRRSLLILKEESRYYWTHEILKRKNDTKALDITKNKYKNIERGTRISITVRKIL